MFGSSKIKKHRFEINSQGYKLRGFILCPEGTGRFPAVIVSHGFASSTHDTKEYAMVFAEEGYVAVCFDFCMSGSGRSSGSSLGMSVMTEKADLLNVLDYVRKLDFVDSGHITLAGCSQGGLVSALAAVERESEIERLIMYYPALCIPHNARHGRMLNAKFDPDHVPEKFWALFVRLGFKYIYDAIRLEPFREICSFRKPVFIVHGTKDKLVDINYSRRASREYPNCRLVEVNGDHGFRLRGFGASKRATVEYLRSGC